jgi:pentatricopeptide repeat protein
MYVLCGSFDEAKTLFYRVEKDSPEPWNWLIRGLTMGGWFEFAILFYLKMWQTGVVPDRYTYPHVIKSCCAISALKLGHLIHKTISLLGLDTNLFVGSSLIRMYATNGQLIEARDVFDRMPQRDTFMWNVMLDGYITSGCAQKGLDLFETMRKADTDPDFMTFCCLLSVCASQSMLTFGARLHGLVIKHGLDLHESVSNTLLAMYSKLECLTDVKKLFNMMPHKNLVTWNSIISGFVQNGLITESLNSFHQMQKYGIKPDSVTLASFIPALANNNLLQCLQIHAYVIINDIYMDAFLASALMDVYFKCKNVNMAQEVFHCSRELDVVTYSTMVSGYVLNGMCNNAIKIFRLLLEKKMKPNAIILASLLPACTGLTAFKLGKELHAHILKNEYENKCYVASALIDMYGKCGRLDLCQYIFDNINQKDIIAWNSMITNCSQNGEPKRALSLFREMGNGCLGYDSVTVSSALCACASMPALNYGKEIHGFITKGFLRTDICTQSALIDMYGKCGNLELARIVFDNMAVRSKVSWNSMISAYGSHGRVKDSIELFQQMKDSGFEPNNITFLGLISACAHAGEVEKGYQIFQSMTDIYAILPHQEHFACIVDLFSRAGQLDKALHFIGKMPCKPNASIWGTILGACRVHRNVEVAELASEKLFELEPENSGYYVLMSNVNAVSDRWDGVSRVRSLMSNKEVKKVPGSSWIEVNGVNHVFCSTDKRNPEWENVHFVLKGLLLVLRDEGYIPNL